MKNKALSACAALALSLSLAAAARAANAAKSRWHPAPATPLSQPEAEKACADALKDPKANAVLPPDPYQRECVQAAMRDSSFIAYVRREYRRAVRHVRAQARAPRQP